MKKKFLILGIALMLTFIVTVTAFADKPAEVIGYFDEFVPGEGDIPTVYCLHTGGTYGVPDGLLDGCVVQPVKDGLGEHGTWEGTVDGKSGTCEYNLRTFDLDGIARFAMNRCTGGLAGFHMQGSTAGLAYGMWKGNWHFDP